MVVEWVGEVMFLEVEVVLEEEEEQWLGEWVVEDILLIWVVVVEGWHAKPA